MKWKIKTWKHKFDKWLLSVDDLIFFSFGLAIMLICWVLARAVING